MRQSIPRYEASGRTCPFSQRDTMIRRLSRPGTARPEAPARRSISYISRACGQPRSSRAARSRFKASPLAVSAPERPRTTMARATDSGQDVARGLLRAVTFQALRQRRFPEARARPRPQPIGLTLQHGGRAGMAVQGPFKVEFGDLFPY